MLHFLLPLPPLLFAFILKAKVSISITLSPQHPEADYPSVLRGRAIFHFNVSVSLLLLEVNQEVKFDVSRNSIIVLACTVMT